MQNKCNQNRKRSKRRAIYCPIHGYYLDSTSQKYNLYTDEAVQLQKRGIGRKNALILVGAKTVVPLEGEWLEAFWCDRCEETKWYYIKKYNSTYEVAIAPSELWQQATGVIHPQGNPSVGEFTQRQARKVGYSCTQDFR